MVECPDRESSAEFQESIYDQVHGPGRGRTPVARRQRMPLSQGGPVYGQHAQQQGGPVCGLPVYQQGGPTHLYGQPPASQGGPFYGQPVYPQGGPTHSFGQPPMQPQVPQGGPAHSYGQPPVPQGVPAHSFGQPPMQPQIPKRGVAHSYGPQLRQPAAQVAGVRVCQSHGDPVWNRTRESGELDPRIEEVNETEEWIVKETTAGLLAPAPEGVTFEDSYQWEEVDAAEKRHLSVSCLLGAYTTQEGIETTDFPYSIESSSAELIGVVS